ncbi:hypothetical protein D3C75_224180 [compost metagenome]
MSHQEKMYKATAKFGDITTEAMSLCRDSAIFTAVGQAWSEHTMSEFKRGYITSMPCISTFSSVEQLDSFLKEMSEDRDPDEDVWMSYSTEEFPS